MADYRYSANIIKRSAGQSSVASAAYRSASRLVDDRTGEIHDYTRKQGIEETFILTPKDAPDWATDRSRLWNEVEASETRRNSVTAREWELALPSEISAEDRSQITRDFAQELVSRYARRQASGHGWYPAEVEDETPSGAVEPLDGKPAESAAEGASPAVVGNCPECRGELIMMDGCPTCYAGCGWSKCG